jgi:hypothetical protein
MLETGSLDALACKEVREIASSFVGEVMKRANPDSAEEAARLAKRTFAVEDGAKAVQPAEAEAAAIRNNMARLRELRLAKEAQETCPREATAVTKKPKRRVRVIR